jgi:Mn2+/Fe2+ NRAMP family transporter
LARPGTGSPAGPGRASRRRRSQLRGPGYFRRLGPGIVTGAADDDPAVIAASMLLGVAMDFTGVSPIRALYLSAILNGVVAPPLVLIVLLARSRAVLGRHRSGLLSQLLVGAAAVVMAALSLLALLP